MVFLIVLVAILECIRKRRNRIARQVSMNRLNMEIIALNSFLSLFSIYTYLRKF